MVKVSQIANTFFGGDTDALLNELAAHGFKVNGWKEDTELPLAREDFRGKIFVFLNKNGITERQFSSALNNWRISTAETKTTTNEQPVEPMNAVGGGGIEKIEDTVTEAIAVQNAGIQQVSEAQLDFDITQNHQQGVTEGVILELSRMEGQFETRMKIRQIVSEVNGNLHKGQANKAFNMATKLVSKIQENYSKTVEANQKLKKDQTNTEEAVNEIFAKIGGLCGEQETEIEGK